jgi:hypothetical protein
MSLLTYIIEGPVDCGCKTDTTGKGPVDRGRRTGTAGRTRGS